MSAPGEASHGWQAATVAEIVHRTRRIASIFLRSALRHHIAGQHVDVRLVAEDGYEARRSYSIASAPDADLLELLVERLDDGEVSPFLHDVLRVGDSLELRGPIGGHFVWRGDEPGPLLLIAGGSGIAPLLSMLRHRAATHGAGDALLLYSAQRWADLVCPDELIAMAERDTHCRIVVTTTREAARRPGDHGRRIDDAMLVDVLARWARQPHACYVCGSTGFVEAVTGGLVDAGIAPGVIRAERYGGL